MTKTIKLIIGIVAALVIVAGALLLVSHFQRRGESETGTTTDKTLRGRARIDPATVLRLPPLAKPVTEAPVAPVVKAMPGEDGAAPALMVRVPVGQVLATVNRIPVTARDLSGVDSNETEIQMDPDIYESRMQRAIDMNLTFQAAQSQRVGLTAEQQARLGEIRARSAQQFAEMAAEHGTTRSTVTEAQLAFQERLTAALLLQQNLVELETGAAPNPDPDKQAAYEAARRAMLDKWRAAATIQIAAPVQQ